MLMRAVMHHSLPCCSSVIRHERRQGRRRGSGTRTRSKADPSAAGSELSWACEQPALVCTNHSINIQQPVTENDHKANLLPVFSSSSKAHLYPHNEVVEHRAARGAGDGGGHATEKKTTSQGDKRSNYPPVEGTFIFPRETHKHATRSSQFHKDR